jgi:hypothetical protein
MPNPRAAYNEDVVEYAYQLKDWFATAKTSPRPPAPPIPWVLSVDMSLGGSRGCVNDLLSRVKEGYFDSFRIVVFHEKHGDRYFKVSCPNDFGLIAIKIVKERYQQNWYPQISDPILRPTKPKLTVEQAVDMDEQIQDTVARLWQEYARQKASALDIEEDVALLKDALHEDNGIHPPSAAIAAVRLLAKRRGYEYEGYDVITPEQA